jgi:hypothetical protein
VKPYDVFGLDLPCPSSTHQIGGAAYDSATNRLFVSQQMVAGDSKSYPVIHVFSLT